MAYHKVDMHVIPEKEYFILETLSKTERTVQYLPMIWSMLKPSTEIFKEPIKAWVLMLRV